MIVILHFLKTMQTRMQLVCVFACFCMKAVCVCSLKKSTLAFYQRATVISHWQLTICLYANQLTENMLIDVTTDDT